MDFLSNYNNKELFYLVFLACINVVSFILFGIDKKRAENKEWRISEGSLIGISFLGGAMGSLIGMVVFKHKLSKRKFYLGLPSILVLNKVIELIIINYIR